MKRRGFFRFVSRGLLAAGYVGAFGLPSGVAASAPVTAPEGSLWLARYDASHLANPEFSPVAHGSVQEFRGEAGAEPALPRGWTVLQRVPAGPRTRGYVVEGRNPEPKAVPNEVESQRTDLERARFATRSNKRRWKDAQLWAYHRTLPRHGS